MAPRDDHVVWEGTSRSARVQGSYRLTRDALSIEVDGSHATRDVIPLEIVVKAEVARSLLQRMRGVADVRLELDRQARPLQPVATLCDLADATRACDAIVEQADRVRRDAIGRRFEAQSRPVDVPNTSLPESVGSGAELPIAQQLRELAALHDGGIVTDEEFQRLKARLIDG